MVVSESDSDRENWIRLTLRLPPRLHAEIVNSAGAKSLNTAIVELLEDALRDTSLLKSAQATLEMAAQMKKEADFDIEQKIEVMEIAIAKSRAADAAQNQAEKEELLKSIRKAVHEEIEKALDKRRS